MNAVASPNELVECADSSTVSMMTRKRRTDDVVDEAFYIPSPVKVTSSLGWSAYHFETILPPPSPPLCSPSPTALSPPKQKKTVRWSDDLSRWTSENSNRSHESLCLPTKPTRSSDSTSSFSYSSSSPPSPSSTSSSGDSNTWCKDCRLRNPDQYQKHHRHGSFMPHVLDSKASEMPSLYPSPCRICSNEIGCD